MANLRVDKIAAVGVSTENTGSVFFDGTDDSLNIAANADFAYGTGDFTWEFWFKTDAGFVEGDGGYLIDHAPADSDGNDGAVWVGSNTLKYHSAPLGGVTNLLFGSVSNETWYHVAVARESGTTRLFLDGLLVNSASDSANYTTSNTRFRIGDYIGTNYAFKGYISNLRICKGHAVYTSTFTPPTRELEVHPETVLLACYDGENIFADKTGRHIIATIGDRLSSPTPTATDSPVGVTTHNPGLIRSVDATNGPVLKGNFSSNSQNWLTLPKGTTTERFPNFGAVDATSARGVFMGGGNTPRVNTIDYVTISTLGDATDFGDLSAPNYNHTGGASNTRGIIGGGLNPANTNLIEYITIQSTGNTKDFGDLSSATEQLGGASNSTRCLFAGGYTTEHVNTIDFITISTSGNTFDFGDLTATKRSQGGLASPNRALFAAGGNPGVSVNIDYVTIMSTGNAVDFGDISGSGGRQGNNGCSTNTRGCWGGGYNGPAGTDAIQYVTIATLGNAQPFGDLSVATLFSGATSSSTRGVWGGGYKPAVSNTIEYITMATLGDANNFGDLSQARISTTSVSNGHGGLG